MDLPIPIDCFRCVERSALGRVSCSADTLNDAVYCITHTIDNKSPVVDRLEAIESRYVDGLPTAVAGHPITGLRYRLQVTDKAYERHWTKSYRPLPYDANSPLYKQALQLVQEYLCGVVLVSGGPRPTTMRIPQEQREVS